MSGLLISVVVVLLLCLLFVFLATRAWRIRTVALRVVGTVVAVLLAIILGLAGVLGALGYAKLTAVSANPVPEVRVSSTPDRVAFGEKIARGCAGCHSTAHAPPLDGGTQDFFGAGSGPPFGTLVPPNLTPAGPLKDWSDGEIMRAIREGVDKDGHPLLIMPSDVLHNLSDDDAESLVAYLRSQPPVQHSTPARSVNLLGAMLIGAGAFPTSEQPPITQPIVAPPRGASAAYGKYLVDISGCRTCHGENLTGGTNQFTPKGPNLAALVPTWSDADFIKTIRTGVDPGGHQLDPNLMPWKDLSAAYSDDDLRAIYTYLHGLPQGR